MATGASTRLEPATPEEAAAALADVANGGEAARFAGGGTKRHWGRPLDREVVELTTRGLDRVVEHNAGDMTAAVEAGLPLARAQEVFAEAGQMLALDAPNPGGSATVGGVVASGDSGPLRHRYGAARDLLLGIRVALADGTLARSGGRVIKNVAGYDLAKLFAGSFGTLGVIVEVVVRLHPIPPGRRTIVGAGTDPDVLGRAVSELAGASLELECLDVRWGGGRGAVLARVAGRATEERAARCAASMAAFGLDVSIEEDDRALWTGQRSAQRSAEGTVVRVSSVRSETANVLRTAERAGAWAVGRGGLGLWWLTLSPGPTADVVTAIAELRATLSPRPCVILDAPAAVRAAVDVWGPSEPIDLLRRVQQRFDPDGVCNPGVFVGGL